MDLVVIGASGLLGREIARQAVLAGHRVTATYLRAPVEIPGVQWRRMDLRGPVSLSGVVINAAYQQSDWATTADGAANVVVAAASVGARLVHVSSDAVFSGSCVHYDESCVPDPITPYGAAKAAAETVVKAVLPGAVIARTSLIVGGPAFHSGPSGPAPAPASRPSVHEQIVHTLIDGSRAGVLFTDDMRCPVHVSDLSQALLELAAGTASGIRHVAGADAVSRHELGRLIAHRDGLDPARLQSGLRSDTDLGGPIDVRLDSTATQAQLTTRLRGAREFLSQR